MVSLWAIGAGACFALFAVALEKVASSQQRFLTKLRSLAMVFFASFVVVSAVAYYAGSRPTADWVTWGILVANGVRVAFVYVFFYAAIERIGALLTSVLVSLEVGLTMLWDFILLGKEPAATLWIGAIIIVFGGLTLVVQDEARTPAHA